MINGSSQPPSTPGRWAEERASWKPTPEQELLLRACLIRGDTGIDAWKRWRACVDINALDPGSQRLLPLLHQNLKAHGISQDIDGKLKGAYRETWYKNQLLFHRAATTMNLFRDAGIKTLVFKGPTLAVLYYGDIGLRPMNDFDLLVEKQNVSTVIEILKRSGWAPTADMSSVPLDFVLEMQNSYGFINTETRAELDLHWHAFFECPTDNFDDQLWRRSSEVDLHGIRTRALDPTDELIYVCLHGSRTNRIPPIRWVADASAILKSSAPVIDWDRILRIAVSEKIVLPLKETFAYFAKLISGSVPTEFLSSLQEQSVLAERIERWSSEAPPSIAKVTLGLWFYVDRKQRRSPLAVKLFRFLKYIQLRWRVRQLWHLPFVVLNKIYRKRQKLRNYSNPMLSANFEN